MLPSLFHSSFIPFHSYLPHSHLCKWFFFWFYGSFSIPYLFSLSIGHLRIAVTNSMSIAGSNILFPLTGNRLAWTWGSLPSLQWDGLHLASVSQKVSTDTIGVGSKTLEESPYTHSLVWPCFATCQVALTNPVKKGWMSLLMHNPGYIWLHCDPRTSLHGMLR